MRPVTFVNRAGTRLAGILHEAGGRGDAAAILLSPGVKSRVAPHRLYPKIADRLVACGVSVLRFDFHGLGDSEGSVPEPLLQDLYGAIQSGRYVNDTHDAIDWLRGETGVGRVILGGLCGGAITGVLAAAARRDVAGIFGLGLPVSLDGAGVDAVRSMSTGQLAGIRAGYRRKLLDASSWRRLLTLQTDFSLVARSFTAAARGRRPVATPQNLNPHLAPALFRVLSQGCRVLLLFAEADRLLAEYREKFEPLHGEALKRHADRLEVRVVKAANHVFTFPEWQQEMREATTSWLHGVLDDTPARATAPRRIDAAGSSR